MSETDEDQPAIVITRGQLAAMTGRHLTPEFVARMDEVWPNSSIPEALAIIADSIAEETGAYPEWDDQDVADHLTGSGATSYSWWRSLTRQADGTTYLVSGDNPDDETEQVVRTVTADDVRRVRAEMLGDRHKVNDRVLRDLRDDPDADAVDCLLQVLVYGEVVYG
jgi:hypothetical protein